MLSRPSRSRPPTASATATEPPSAMAGTSQVAFESAEVPFACAISAVATAIGSASRASS